MGPSLPPPPSGISRGWPMVRRHRSSSPTTTSIRCTTQAIRNLGHVNDATVADLLNRQRRIQDVAKRRELIYEIQRYLATQQYYVETFSGVLIAVWDGALKNYGPNLGYDYGGRLVAAWLDR